MPEDLQGKQTLYFGYPIFNNDQSLMLLKKATPHTHTHRSLMLNVINCTVLSLIQDISFLAPADSDQFTIL